MNFHEINRTSVPHTECILYTYLQDANGLPVAGVKMKVWAGPPPRGEPPSFVDDDPNNPNRRTDSTGKFQFIVAGGPVPARTDFFVQPLDRDNEPLSGPVQYTFEAGRADWITVTLASEAIPSPVPVAPESIPEMEEEPGSAPESMPEDIEPETATAAEPPRAESVVRGTILNALSGTQVTLESPDLSRVANVDDFGGYSLEHLPAGEYALSISGVGVVNNNLVLDGASAVVVNYTIRPQAPAASARKVLAHYVLFGATSAPGTLTNLILSLDYLVRFGAAAGFRAEEAEFAEHVTIVGDTNAVSAADEKRLRDAGCQVTRLTAPDSYALERVFQQLIASNSPYPKA